MLKLKNIIHKINKSNQYNYMQNVDSYGTLLNDGCQPFIIALVAY